MITTTVEIIDVGRGPQLSTCRITVLDLVRYFRQGSSRAEILRWIPTLSEQEIAAVERYYLDHRHDLDELDDRAVARREEQVRLQRLRFPELNGTRDENLARLKRLLDHRASSTPRS